MAYSLSEFKKITLEIVDVQGKKVLYSDLDPEGKIISIDNLNLENGIYFYTIKGDEKSLMTKKLVVLK
ncbi:MAG: T9SS type A sorting domain-containing protein [Bacteroidetes bacterium]|nr:T9SS type A sorting domain-containing protein [Bacteroidota bacterium]